MTIGAFLLQTLLNTAIFAGAFYILYGFIF